MYLSHRQRKENSLYRRGWKQKQWFVLSRHFSWRKTPILYIISRIRHYTSSGLTNVICQDFQTELLFVFNHWGWTPPPPLLSSPVYLFPSLWDYITLTEDGESLLESYFSCTDSPMSEFIAKWCEIFNVYVISSCTVKQGQHAPASGWLFLEECIFLQRPVSVRVRAHLPSFVSSR